MIHKFIEDKVMELMAMPCDEHTRTRMQRDYQDEFDRFVRANKYNPYTLHDIIKHMRDCLISKKYKAR